MRDIVVFAGPTMGLWICGPLMSLIDTAVISQSSSLELTALGPGMVFCDYLCYIFYCAQTNLLRELGTVFMGELLVTGAAHWRAGVVDFDIGLLGMEASCGITEAGYRVLNSPEDEVTAINYGSL